MVTRPNKAVAKSAVTKMAPGCVIGSIPPFALSAEVTLVVDPELPARYAEVAFNAGSLQASIVLDAADYLRIAQPRLCSICGE